MLELIDIHPQLMCLTDAHLVFEILWHIDDELEVIALLAEKTDEVDDEAEDDEADEVVVADNEIIDELEALDAMLDEVVDELEVLDVHLVPDECDEDDEMVSVVVYLELVCGMLDDDEVETIIAVLAVPIMLDAVLELVDDIILELRLMQNVIDDDDELDEQPLDVITTNDANEYLYSDIQQLVDTL